MTTASNTTAMERLSELALNKYQSNLAIIQTLFVMGSMTKEAYQDSMRSANNAWSADRAEITGLELRRRLLQ